MAVTSAGHMQVCTSLQTDNHVSTSPLSFFTGRMPFLPPNQQHQSTEGICTRQITTPAPHLSFLHAGCPSCQPTNSEKALKATSKHLKATKSLKMTTSHIKYFSTCNMSNWLNADESSSHMIGNCDKLLCSVQIWDHIFDVNSHHLKPSMLHSAEQT